MPLLRFHLEYCMCNQLTSLLWFPEDEATLVKRYKEERISWSTVNVMNQLLILRVQQLRREDPKC